MEIINFDNQDIRLIENNVEKWYSVIDVIGAITDSTNPSAYWRKLRSRLDNERSEIVTNCHKLKLKAADGKRYATDCATRETLLRLIQSVPSPSVEPFKQWLANAGEQNIQETENPELLIAKVYDHYRDNGMDDDWIDARIRSMNVRNSLT